MIDTPQDMAKAILENNRPELEIKLRPTIQDLITNPQLRTALAMDGDVTTGLDQALAFSGNEVANVDEIFARDGNLATKRDLDQALDGNVVKHSRNHMVDDVVRELREKSEQNKRDLKKSSEHKLPTPWDEPPAPILKKTKSVYD